MAWLHFTAGEQQKVPSNACNGRGLGMLDDIDALVGILALMLALAVSIMLFMEVI